MGKDRKAGGFLLLKTLRVLPKIGVVVAPLCFLVLWIPCILILARRNNMSGAELAGGIISIMFVLMLCYFTFKNMPIVNAQYCYSRHGILNIIKNKKIGVNLQTPFFCSTIVIRFYIKSGYIPQSYYVFSSEPLGYISEMDMDGLRALEDVWKKGAVLLPKNEVDVIHFCSMDIPDYPRVLYCPRKTGDGLREP